MAADQPVTIASHYRPLSVGYVVATVCAVAALGMVLGAVFGYLAGSASPSLFKHILAYPGNNIEVEPRGVATFLGATAGTVLGGALGAFSLAVHVASKWIAVRRN